MNTNEAIAELAYRLWEAHGRPEGTHDQDWLAAERQLAIASKTSEDERPHNLASAGWQKANKSLADNTLEHT